MIEHNKTFSNEMAENGFAVFAEIFSEQEIESLLAGLQSVFDDADGRRRGGKRNLLTHPSILALATCGSLRNLIEPVLGEKWRPVRAILFDKTPQANWKVPWHQDLSIAVSEKVEVDGYGPWSVKAGIPHVQPPVDVLNQMVAVRIHLDECGMSNGPLRVIPGSHRFGRIPEQQIEEYVQQPSTTCDVAAGGVLLMKPLLLHASSPAQSPRHRRVIHVEYAAVELSAGLRWYSDSKFESDSPPMARLPQSAP